MNKQIMVGADIHAGDGEYSIGTQEEYNEFMNVRNKSLAQARIKELVEQAWVYQMRVYETDGVRTFGEREQVFDKEKFAELVAKECVNVVESTAKDYDDRSMFLVSEMTKNISDRIKQHFGVEE